MQTESRNEVLRIVTLALRPLVRLLVHYGVGLADVVETIKRLYVDVASERLKAERTKVTDSSVSVMTGVHRKDVRRIQEETVGARPRPPASGVLDLVSRVWTGSTRFLNARGQPRALPRRTTTARHSKGTPTFEDLIEEVTKGVPPRALLDEWLRLGAVKLNSRGEVTYAAPEYAEGAEIDQLRRSMIANSDRLTASISNVIAGERKHMVYWVRAAYIEDDDMEKLKEFAERLSRQLGDKLNKRVTEAEEHGKASGKGKLRFSFALHIYDEPMQLLERQGFKLW